MPIINKEIKPNILCFGDSLTFGAVGYSYIHFLSNARCINKGLNGDTIVHMHKRLQRYLTTRNYNDIDFCIIAIGTNDLLLPFLSKLPGLWKFTKARVKLMQCCTTEADFKNQYLNLVQYVNQINIKSIFIGIPYIELTGFPLDTLQKRNETMRELVEKNGHIFIDICSIQTNEKNFIPKSYSWGYTNFMRMVDYVIMFLFPFTKQILSKIRKLVFTVDGVHNNDFSANLLAKKIEDKIKSIKGNTYGI